jgi:hypothetical protein
MVFETSFGFAIPNDTNTEMTFTASANKDQINFDFVCADTVNVFKIAETNVFDYSINMDDHLINGYVNVIDSAKRQTDWLSLNYNYSDRTLFTLCETPNTRDLPERPAWNSNCNCKNTVKNIFSLRLLERPCWSCISKS